MLGVKDDLAHPKLTTVNPFSPDKVLDWEIFERAGARDVPPESIREQTVGPLLHSTSLTGFCATAYPSYNIRCTWSQLHEYILLYKEPESSLLLALHVDEDGTKIFRCFGDLSIYFSLNTALVPPETYFNILNELIAEFPGPWMPRRSATLQPVPLSQRGDFDNKIRFMSLGTKQLDPRTSANPPRAWQGVQHDLVLGGLDSDRLCNGDGPKYCGRSKRVLWGESSSE